LFEFSSLFRLKFHALPSLQQESVILYVAFQDKRNLFSTEPGFNSCRYSYKSLVAAGKASDPNCSHSPVQVLRTSVGTSKHLSTGVNDIKFGYYKYSNNKKTKYHLYSHSNTQ